MHYELEKELQLLNVGFEPNLPMWLKELEAAAPSELDPQFRNTLILKLIEVFLTGVDTGINDLQPGKEH